MNALEASSFILLSLGEDRTTFSNHLPWPSTAWNDKIIIMLANYTQDSQWKQKPLFLLKSTPVEAHRAGYTNLLGAVPYHSHSCVSCYLKESVELSYCLSLILFLYKSGVLACFPNSQEHLPHSPMISQGRFECRATQYMCLGTMVTALCSTLDECFFFIWRV